MHHNPSDNHINVITWIPEGKAWGSVGNHSYNSPKVRVRKILVVCLVICIGLSFYNPITTYKSQNFNRVEVEVDLQQSTTEA